MFKVTLHQSNTPIRNLRPFGWVEELETLLGRFKMIEKSRMEGRGWQYVEYNIFPNDTNDKYTVTLNLRRH